MIKPLRDLLYILPMDDPDKRGSLYVPEQAKQRVDQGIVYLRGPQTSGEIQVGDHVFFSGYDGSREAIEGEGIVVIVPEKYIHAVVADEKSPKLFTDATVKKLIQQGLGDLVARGHLPQGSFPRANAIPTAEYIEDYLINLFDSYFDAEGLIF